MNTYDEILEETIHMDFVHENVTNISPETKAAKEYAKMWIDAAMSFEGNAMEMLEYMKQLKNEIDKQ